VFDVVGEYHLGVLVIHSDKMLVHNLIIRMD
jgi:hypothetical protein